MRHYNTNLIVLFFSSSFINTIFQTALMSGMKMKIIQNLFNLFPWLCCWCASKNNFQDNFASFFKFICLSHFDGTHSEAATVVNLSIYAFQNIWHNFSKISFLKLWWKFIGQKSGSGVFFDWETGIFIHLSTCTLQNPIGHLNL